MIDRTNDLQNNAGEPAAKTGVGAVLAAQPAVWPVARPQAPWLAA